MLYKKTKARKSPCCRAEWHWEVLHGIRLYRETLKGKRYYHVRCPKCRLTYCKTN